MTKGFKFGEHQTLLSGTISTWVLEDPSVNSLQNISGVVQPIIQIEEPNVGRNTPDSESDPNGSKTDNTDCDRSGGNSEEVSEMCS